MPSVRNSTSCKRTSKRVVAEQQAAIEAAAEQAALARERVDLSLPGVERPIGSRHLIRQTFDEIERIFLSLGFTVVEGPEIETPYYNFEALNIPEHHPARDTMDTFYMETPRRGAAICCARTLRRCRFARWKSKRRRCASSCPARSIAATIPTPRTPTCFTRSKDWPSIRTSPSAISKAPSNTSCANFLGPKTKTRLRPSYFPFTEPSVEVDATCLVCGGNGCRVCKQSGWIELFGAGMVDPAVYGFVNYDAKRLSGFAFGLGVDRLSQMKYGIDDVQLLFQNDVRFLRQF